VIALYAEIDRLKKLLEELEQKIRDRELLIEALKKAVKE
jgi:thymidylate synthase